MCQTLGMRTCCVALRGNFLSSPGSLQMAYNCFLNDLSVQAAGTWSERPFHIFISLWMRIYSIKPLFTLSKEPSVQKKWWSWWTTSCDCQCPVGFLFFPSPSQFREGSMCCTWVLSAQALPSSHVWAKHGHILLSSGVKITWTEHSILGIQWRGFGFNC